MAKPEAADLTNPDSNDVDPWAGAVTELAADQHDHPMSTSIPASSCHCSPGAGVDNAGPLALVTIDFSNAAAEIADHSIETTMRIPKLGTEDEGSLVQADLGHPMAGAIVVFLLW